MTESELHEIFPLNLNLSKGLHDQSKVDTEYWEFLLMLGFGNLSITKGLYQNLRSKIQENDWRMPLVEIGEARFLSLVGRELESFRNLKAASDLLFSPSQLLNNESISEIVALHSYVLTSVWGKISQKPNSLLLLYSGQNLTTVKKFKLAFKYRITASRVKTGKASISELISELKELKENKLWVLACIGYRFLAICYRNAGEFKKSIKCVNTALKIAEENHLYTNIQQTRITEGFTYIKQGDFDQAEKIYSDIFPSNKADSSIPIILENKALIEEGRQHFDKALQCIIFALEVSTKLDMVSVVPGEYLYLGQAYENHYKDFEQAEYYYKQGYDHAMRYASHGISLTGDRKKVVEAYVKIIKHRQGSTTPAKPAQKIDQFAFAPGKSWKEIKDIFQYQLICYHQGDQQNSKALASKLKMPPSTLYSLQTRLKKRGYQLPDKNTPTQTEHHHLFSFIEEHEDLTWEAVNNIFEREIIHYLYEKYGYNKQRMAQVLKLSYPSIITKTRELTQVNEHLLPN